MVKRILLSIVMLMLIAYLGIAITAFNRKPADQTCRDVELVIKESTLSGKRWSASLPSRWNGN